MQPKSHHTKPLKVISMALLVGLSSAAHAGAESFAPGTAIPEFGQVAKVESTLAIPAGMKFKVAFDMSKAADVGQVNRQLDSLARFINMHVAAGVKESDIELAMVVHGSAVGDLADDSFMPSSTTERKTPIKP